MLTRRKKVNRKLSFDELLAKYKKEAEDKQRNQGDATRNQRGTSSSRRPKVPRYHWQSIPWSSLYNSLTHIPWAACVDTFNYNPWFWHNRDYLVITINILVGSCQIKICVIGH